MQTNIDLRPHYFTRVPTTGYSQQITEQPTLGNIKPYLVQRYEEDNDVTEGYLHPVNVH